MHQRYRAPIIIMMMILTALSSFALANERDIPTSVSSVKLDDLVRVNGNLRYGFNYLDDFSDDPAASAHDFRTRLTLNFFPNDKEQGVVEFQSWKLLGGDYYGQGSDDGSINFSQMYISVDDCLGNNIGGKIGRMRYQVANERIIGDDSWSSSQSYDGGVFYLGDKNIFTHYNEVRNHTEHTWMERIEVLKTTPKPSYTTGLGGELLLFKRAENDPAGDDDQEFMGVNLFVPKIGIMPFAYYDRDNELIGGHRREHQYTIGSYGKFDIGKNLLLEGNFAYQMGKFRYGPNDDDKEDIGAYLLQADLFYYAGNYERPIAFGVGIDMTSGDDGEDEDKYKSWTNVTRSPHQFQGRTDLLGDNLIYGLNDIVGRIAYYPSEKVTTGLDLHLLRTNVDYFTGVEDEKSSSIGTEFDFYLRYNMHQRTHWTFELNYLKPSEDWAGEDADAFMTGIVRATFTF